MQIENLDHLRLIAGVINELGLMKLTDAKPRVYKLQRTSAEQVVKAMILNAMGFVSAPLDIPGNFEV